MNQQTHKQLIRQKLKEIDEYKRMGNQLQSHSGEKRRIAFLIEDVILLDPSIAIHEKIDEQLWTGCFYKEFQEIKKRIATNQDESALDQLSQELDFASAYYQNLIMNLSAMYFSHEKAIIKLSAEQIAYKCLISMGDIARYRLINQQSKQKKKWAEAWSWYEKAIELNSNGGKPFLQLAILSSYQQEPIAVLYYNCLGLGNVEPSPNARSNLLLYLQQRKSKAEVDTELENFLQFFLGALNCDEIEFNSLLNTAKGQQYAFLKEPGMNPQKQYFVKMITCLIILLHDLDAQFVKSVNTQSKQTIRNTQTLVLNLLFIFSMKCIDVVSHHLEVTYDEEEKSTMEREKNEEDAKISEPVLESAEALSLVFMYLSVNHSHLLNFTSYGKLLDHKFFTARLFEWAHHVCRLANLLSAFADMEEEELIFNPDSDKYLASLLCFYERFETVSKQSKVIGNMSANYDPSMTFYSRIGSSVLKIAKNNALEFLILNAEIGTFLVRDDDARRRERQIQMRALATERLKSQVEDLETKQGSFKHLDHPIYLLDLDCFLFHLHVVKRFLMSKSCSIIVCLEVIQMLDVLKKGHGFAVQAREAIRYLEQRFKYPSPWLIGQKPEERSVCWGPDGSFQGAIIPTPLQRILGACLYFQSQSVQRIRGGDFFLVTDHDELRDVALHLSIPVLPIYEFSMRLRAAKK